MERATFPAGVWKRWNRARGVAEWLLCKTTDMSGFSTRSEKPACNFLTMVHIFTVRLRISRVRTLHDRASI